MARRRNRGMGVVGVAAVVVVVLIACVSAVMLNTWVGRAGSVARVNLPASSTLASAADSLRSARVIRSAMLFRVWAAVNGGGRVVPGRYLITRGGTVRDVLLQLRTGTGRFHRLTIPEGWGIRQIAKLVNDSLRIPVESILVATKDSARRARMSTTAADVEGYLFPATYEFFESVTAAGVVDTMLLTFDRRWKSAWDSTLKSQGRSRQELVTLASIVEKEAGRSSDRPMIAAVYLNRLRKGMRLQADPTVLYAMGLVAKRVLYADLRTESPYNTYRVAGLPPGPIASPGTESLAAAIAPADTDALYFVAFPDGHSQFSRTLAEHNAAVKASRLARDAGTAK